MLGFLPCPAVALAEAGSAAFAALAVSKAAIVIATKDTLRRISPFILMILLPSF
jgi:hypothetical protein